MNHFPVARESWPYIAVLLVITVLAGLWKVGAGVFFLLLLGVVVFFFRNPERKVPEGEGLIVSPADGVIIAVDEVEEKEFLHSAAKRISIFLSLFDVHVNRSPIAGKVNYFRYQSGKCLPAYRKEASSLNERNLIGIEGEGLKVLVVQIAGLVARRVVCWAKLGNSLQRGERLGLIKFGSCVEVYLPLSVGVEVKKGDRVWAGETILGRVR